MKKIKKLLTKYRNGTIIKVSKWYGKKERGIKMREWLRNARREKGISQESLSKKIGISRAHYTRIENGYRQQKMTIEMAQKLATVLDIPIETVLQNEKAEGSNSNERVINNANL